MDLPTLVPRLVVPAIVLAVAVVLGGVLDRMAISRVRATAARSGWTGGEVAARSLAGLVPIWAALAALWWGFVHIQLAPRTEHAILNTLTVLAVLSVTWAAARLAGGLVRLYTARSDTPIPSASIFVNLTRLSVGAVGLLVGLNAIGVQIAPLLTALGVGGLAVALALQQTLSNLFSGLQLSASRQFHPGDVVRLVSGEEGSVEDTTWRTTTLRQPSGALVIVPNSVLASVVAVNRGPRESEHPVTVSVSVPYEADLARIEALAAETALGIQRELEAAVTGHVPVPRFTRFDPGGVVFEVGLKARTHGDRAAVRSEYMKRLHARLAEEGTPLAASPV